MSVISTAISISWISLPHQIHRKNCLKLHDNPLMFCNPISRVSLKSSKTTPSAALNQTISPQITNCNEKIRRFCEVGSLKEAVDTLCRSPKSDLQLGTYCSVLQLCAERKSLSDGRKVHSVILSNSWQVDSVLGAKLVFMYVNCGDLATGREIFDQIANEKVYLWNILINEYAKVGNFGEGICLYHKMKEFGVVPNSYTFSCVLKCFSGLGSLEEGRKAHGRLLKLYLDADTAVVNSLINFYFKCRRVKSAQKLFVKLLDRDIISWNSMISGFASNDLPEKGVEIFDRMLQAGLMPNLTTVTCVLAACADIGVLEFGRMLHGYVLKTGFTQDLACKNTLLDMYAKCGDLDSAIQVFENMVDRSVVSCTSMIAAYAREGLSHAAIRLFHEMRDGALRPDAFTVSTLLNACASSSLLDNGKEIHDYVKENKMQSNVSICNALMDMYVKCGSIQDAQSVFSQMSARDTISWNTMIAGCSKNGLPNEALNLFLEMQHESKPDCITMSCILPSCASLAALERGKEIHAHILRNGQIDHIYVANALVDMYMKCGALMLAHLAFVMIARRDLISWTIMTAGYCLHGLGNEAMSSFNEMRNEGIEPDENSFSSILFGCRHSGLLNEGRQFFTMMENDYGIKPKLEHYTCMVYLLANAGRLTEAYRFIEKMPLKADAAVWVALLQGCRVHHNLKLAEKVAERIFELQPDNKASYMRLANIYSEAKIWDKVKWLKDKIGHLGKKKNQVCSWIEVKGKVQIFFAGNVASHPESKKIETFLKKLKCKMTAARCTSIPRSRGVRERAPPQGVNCRQPNLKCKMNGENYIRSTKYAMMDKDEVEKEVALCGHSEVSAMVFGLLNLARGNTIRVTKNSRICHECHDMAKFISKTLGREIILRDSLRFHHFKDALCSCRG